MKMNTNDTLTKFEQLESDLELLLWNDSFGIYSDYEFESNYKIIIQQMEFFEE